MDPLSPPPPVRRILVGEAPTVAPPPTNGNGHLPHAAPASPLRRMPRADTAAIERMRTEELSIAYGQKLAVNQVSLSVRQGEVLALIGPSGCGKTTLLLPTGEGKRRVVEVVLDLLEEPGAVQRFDHRRLQLAP